jgi:hypothetical protein
MNLGVGGSGPTRVSKAVATVSGFVWDRSYAVPYFGEISPSMVRPGA